MQLFWEKLINWEIIIDTNLKITMGIVFLMKSKFLKK